jgi:hypothetical protein
VLLQQGLLLLLVQVLRQAFVQVQKRQFWVPAVPQLVQPWVAPAQLQLLALLMQVLAVSCWAAAGAVVCQVAWLVRQPLSQHPP